MEIDRGLQSTEAFADVSLIQVLGVGIGWCVLQALKEADTWSFVSWVSDVQGEIVLEWNVFVLAEWGAEQRMRSLSWESFNSVNLFIDSIEGNLFLLFVEFTFILSCGLLVLLIFRHQIVHVGFSLSEFHLVHTFTSIPMQESLAPEHSSELFADTFEQL